jgi:hypothetical protein
MSSTNIFRGARGLSEPLVDDIESYWSPAEKVQAMGHARSIIGSPDTVRSGMDAPIAVNGRRQIHDSCPTSMATRPGCNPSSPAPEASPANFDHFRNAQRRFAGVTSCAQQRHFITPEAASHFRSMRGRSIDQDT